MSTMYGRLPQLSGAARIQMVTVSQISYDMCPTIPGIQQNNGCPEIKKEEQEVINKAFDNLEFETGKAS